MVPSSNKSPRERVYLAAAGFDLFGLHAESTIKVASRK